MEAEALLLDMLRTEQWQTEAGEAQAISRLRRSICYVCSRERPTFIMGNDLRSQVPHLP